MQITLLALSGLSPANGQDVLGLSILMGSIYAVGVWLLLVIAVPFVAFLSPSFLERRRFLGILAIWSGATFVPPFLTIIVWMSFTLVTDSTPFKQGGSDCPGIVQNLAFITPITSVLIGAGLGRWLVIRKRSRIGRW